MAESKDAKMTIKKHVDKFIFNHLIILENKKKYNSILVEWYFLFEIHVQRHECIK